MGHLLFAIFLLTFSIFVHELGHFLVARRCGLVTPRFSIFGIGNPIWKWQWRGVEYCICWLPIGAYVMIPQLADLGEFEGDLPEDYRNLPKARYRSIVLVALAGPFANILLALALATVVWQVGIQVPAEFNRTEIGEVAREITNSQGQKVPGPAAVAGLQAGDVITAIDGKSVKDFADIWNAILLSGNRTGDDRRLAVIAYTRNGEARTATLYPELAGPDAVRVIGISPRSDLIVDQTQDGSAAAQAGLLPGDRILAVNGRTLYERGDLRTFLQTNKDAEIALSVQRGTGTLQVALKPRLQTNEDRTYYLIGVVWRIETVLVHKTPLEQFSDVFENIARTFSTLANRNSDIGVRHMSSIVGIVDNLQMAAAAGIVPAFSLLIMINLSLAIFNLLPIPVLDGGHVAMATITKLRGRPLSSAWVQNSVKVCFLLLISLIIYVSYFDIRRVILSHTRETPPATAPAKPAGPAEPDKSGK